LNWPVFSSDEIRKTLAGVPLTQRTPPELRDKLYSGQMTQETYKKLVEEGLGALTAHDGVILDATFSSRTNRDFLRAQCVKANVRLQAMELDVDLATVQDRLRKRDKTASQVSDARLEDFEKLIASYEVPSELAPDLIRVSATGALVDTVKTVLLRLGEKSVTRPDSFHGE
jgi:predicted kinase